MQVRSLFLDAMSALNHCLPDEAHTNHGSDGFVNKKPSSIVSSNSKIQVYFHRVCTESAMAGNSTEPAWRVAYGVRSLDMDGKLEDRSPRSVSSGSWRFVQSA